jgi:7-cyano-7-deazaguanine synthase
MVADQKRKLTGVVLLSGGIDSAACVRYYLDLGFQLKGLFIDYGQRARGNESKSAIQVANHYGIPLDRLSLSPARDFGPGEIRGRNAFFIISALLFYPQFKGILSLGIHSGTPYYDCSHQFINDIKTIIDAYAGGEVQIDAPFLAWDKSMIYVYCKEKGVPIHLTYSCEAGTDPPCSKCLSCKDREALDACR